MKKGFSLLELLVVILIIGILAAVALPQYQLAVDSAEFANLRTIADTLANVYDDQVLVRGYATTHFEDLIISLPDDFEKSYSSSIYNCVSNDKMFCCMSYFYEGSYSGKINCGKKDLSLIYVRNLYDSSGNKLNYKTCRCRSNNKRAQRFCKSIGVYDNEGNTWTPEGMIFYERYKIK